jgi:hypothetical protein
VFLTDDQVRAMTGCERGKHRPVTLRRWLVENGYVEKVDFFKRHDGWYSVMHPHQRTAVEAPRPTVRKRA